MIEQAGYAVGYKCDSQPPATKEKEKEKEKVRNKADVAPSIAASPAHTRGSQGDLLGESDRLGAGNDAAASPDARIKEGKCSVSLDRERPTSREIEARRPFSAPGGDWSCGMRAGAQLSVRECLKGVRVYGGSQGSVVASPRAADLWILKNTLRKEGNWTKKGVHGVEVLRPQTARAMAAAAAARNAAVAAGLQVKMTMRVWGAWGSMDADDMMYSALD